MSLKELINADVFNEIAMLLNNKLDAEKFIGSLNYPIGGCPPFESPYAFWRQFAREIEEKQHGDLDLKCLVDALSSKFPSNDALKSLKLYISPSVGGLKFVHHALTLVDFHNIIIRGRSINLEDEFANIFSSSEKVELLLDKIGYPKPQRPKFDRPGPFWKEICQEISFGIIKERSLFDLIVFALEIYPGNPLLNKVIRQLQG